MARRGRSPLRAERRRIGPVRRGRGPLRRRGRGPLRRRHLRAAASSGACHPDHHFWYAYDGERRVGFLWVKVTRETAFVYNVAVEEDVRRQGYGRAIMLVAERRCHANALTRIGLHVFAHNTGARALYEQLGFSETGRNMAKDL